MVKDLSKRVFVICQILLGWKNVGIKYYYETDELPNPRPTQPKKSWAKEWHLDHFFPQQIRGFGIGFYRKQTTRNLRNPTKFSANAPKLYINRVKVYSSKK